jgi:hypothetical protein
VTARLAEGEKGDEPVPSPWLTRRVPATAILGLGLALSPAAPAAATGQWPVAKVIVRGDRDAATTTSPVRRDSLLILVVLGGLTVVGTGAAIASRTDRPRKPD